MVAANHPVCFNLCMPDGWLALTSVQTVVGRLLIREKVTFTLLNTFMTFKLCHTWVKNPLA